MSILVQHLWESTLCVILAALVALVLKDAPARVRHRIWLCASVKFLVPMSPLVTLGSWFGTWMSPFATPVGFRAVQWLDESLPGWTSTAVAVWTPPEFLPEALRHPAPALIAVWAAGAIALATWRWGQWRRLSGLMHAATQVAHGREAAALARAQPLSTAHGITHVLVSQAGVEPAVLGIVRPTLLWPEGLSGRLTDAHLDAIVVHELCHVRRRDNLSALVHVVVETVFWFHPLVWWLGARLVIERERACDEEVLQMGTDQRRYAEAILKVCHFSVRAPAALAAGVGGAGLSRRIARILSGRTPTPLTNRARVLLASVAVLAAAAPLTLGVLEAQRAISDDGLRMSAWSQAGASGAAQASGDVLRPGGDVTWPKLVHEVKPRYTPEALQARIQGVVVIEAVVLADGTVGDVTVVESLDPDHGLDDEGVHALTQWRFEPATRDGEPVAVLVPVEMMFRLK